MSDIPKPETSIPELGSSVVNDACWKFIEAMPHQLPGPVFNDLKGAVYAAICHVLSEKHTPPTEERDIRNAALEEAARSCETASFPEETSNPLEVAMIRAGEKTGSNLAAAIRRLKAEGESR